jgi:hypothetical protein
MVRSANAADAPASAARIDAISTSVHSCPDLEIREVSAEETAIAREEAAATRLRMRADQEVRDQPCAFAAARAILTPHRASQIGAVAIERIERQASVRERTVHGAGLGKECAHFRPNDGTSQQ